ncbi:MAG: sugar phosphate isomerase/epimerase [Mycobacterium sp.]
MRIAAAPVSWGLCEVPGWGYQMPGARVLHEMERLGIRATELGPPGFLPESGPALRTLLAEHDLSPVGAFAPIVLHDATVDAVAQAKPFIQRLRACGADVLVIGAATGRDGYDGRSTLDREQWDRLVANLEHVEKVAQDSDVRAVLHPHMGTVIERREEVYQLLGSCSVPLCLDTGHLLIGGTDPLELLRTHGDRIAHVQLKDVTAALAAQVSSGETRYSDAVRDGMYTPLGRGDIDIEGLLDELAARSYSGWLVLEQDRVLTEDPVGEGPLADARASIAYLRTALVRAQKESGR